MRASLDKIELVDQYVTGKLTVAEQLNFIKTMETDAELQQLVSLQKDIIKAVQRKALKAEIKTTIREVNLWKKFWKWLIGGGILVIVVVAAPLMLNHSPEKTTRRISSDVPPAVVPVKKEIVFPDSTTKQEERIDFNGLKTWVDPDMQTFKINPAKGATIEGKDGTLIIVPSNAFMDEQNKPVTAEVEFKLVEALKVEDMVLYNLGTTSDGKALGTGGMLYFDFTASGKKVKVDPKRSLYVEVPTYKVKEAMMAFEGEVKNGKINWVNPKPLKKYLVNVDFNLLDFLPAGFEDTIRTLPPLRGQITMSSALTDSLYYSLDFACGYPKNTRQLDLDPGHKKKREGDPVAQKAKQPAPVKAISLEADSSRATIANLSACCGIDPLAIKILKTLPYAKTFIATQEFAERVRALHKLDNGNGFLKIYVENVSKNLSYSDSLVATKLTGESKKLFKIFAKQGLTNIKDAAIYQNQLNAYYSKKKQEYRQAQENWRYTLANKSKGELNQLMTALPSRKNVSNLATPNVATGTSYAFQWTRPGWVNIDCYLHLLSSKSEEVRMTLNTTEYNMELYQWINMVNNLTPLVINGKQAMAVFPSRDKPQADQMKNTFCCAISKKDGAYKWFDLRYNPYETKTIEIDLKPVTIVEIRNKLKSYTINHDLMDRLDQVEKDIAQAIMYKAESEKHMNEMNKMNAMRAKLEAVAYPCKRISKK